jgi:hypothetical protein
MRRQAMACVIVILGILQSGARGQVQPTTV